MNFFFIFLNIFFLTNSFAQDAKDFTLRDQNGAFFNLKESSTKNYGFIGLIFFQTTCAPCVQELVQLKNSYQNHQSVLFILVDSKEERSTTYQFLKKHNLSNFIILNDPYGDLDDIFLIKAVPTIILLNSNRQVVKTFVGNKLSELLSYIELKSSE